MLDDQYEGRVQGYTYAREGHPNATALAKQIDLLEQTDGGIITGSGMAAITALFQTMRCGDHVIIGRNVYGGTYRLATQVMSNHGFEFDFVDTRSLDKVESIGGYQFVWNNNIGDMRAGTPDYGVIAQELEDVLPHAVDINSRGHKTVNYNSLIPLLIEAVKELSARVKELEPEPEEPEEDIDG